MAAARWRKPSGSRSPANPGQSLDLEAFRQVPGDTGASLDQLGAALAKMLDSGDDPYAPAAAEPGGEPWSDPDEQSEQVAHDAACPLSPGSIFEAMLFVGHPQNEPLTSRQVAALMRGVRPAEVDALVVELNASYQARQCPYSIVSQGAGYRLALRDEFAGVREKFYGKLRQARLSQSAIEVLAAVAYHEPIAADDVNRLRGVASGPILLQLVRRQLLSIERDPQTPRNVRYRTTPRFLTLFSLTSLSELPRGATWTKREQASAPGNVDNLGPSPASGASTPTALLTASLL